MLLNDADNIIYQSQNQPQELCIWTFNFTVITVFILMDYPIHIDTINMALSIRYFRGLPVSFYKMMYLCP